MDEAEINDMENIARVYNMTVAELIENTMKKYISELKSDSFYRFTVNVEDASAAMRRAVVYGK